MVHRIRPAMGDPLKIDIQADISLDSAGKHSISFFWKDSQNEK